MFKTIVIAILLTYVSVLLATPVNQEFYFRGRQQTYNQKYEFKTDGKKTILFKKRGLKDSWKKMVIPQEIEKINGISSDDIYLVAIDQNNRVYTMFEGLSDDPSDFYWIDRWGFPFWYGSKIPAIFGDGIKVLKDALAWDVSFFSPDTDKYYQAHNKGKYKVGLGCTNVFVLDKNGQRITYLDPWLPIDYSYEVCAPKKGRFKSVNMSASGSTLFLINQYGDMFTRNYDFDMVGADDVFFTYAYNPLKKLVEENLESGIIPRSSNPLYRVFGLDYPRPLPIPGWTMQTKIDGTITDRITVMKKGEGGLKRDLMVEGINNHGETGFWTKDVSAKEWEFVVTNRKTKGKILTGNSLQDTSDLDLGVDETLNFAGVYKVSRFKSKSYKKVKLEVKGFHSYCSPATVNVTVDNFPTFDLTLHTHETLRYLTRERGFQENDSLELKGAIEISKQQLDYATHLPEPVKDFIFDVFKDSKRFTEVSIGVTFSTLELEIETGLMDFEFVLKN